MSTWQRAASCHHRPHFGQVTCASTDIQIKPIKRMLFNDDGGDRAGPLLLMHRPVAASSAGWVGMASIGRMSACLFLFHSRDVSFRMHQLELLF